MNIDPCYREQGHKKEKEITKVYSVDKVNRNASSPWKTTKVNDDYLHDKYSDSVTVNPIDDSSDSRSTNKKYYFKTPPRMLTVQNRYLIGDASSAGASATDDGSSSSKQRSARRAIARSRRAALENYKTLTSQITQITEDETPYVSVQRSTSRLPTSSFSSFSTWETNDSMADLHQAQVTINTTPSTHRRITDSLIHKDMSTTDGGADSNSDDDDDDSFIVKETTTYTPFSRGIPAIARSVDSDDSGTLFDKLFACCPPTTTTFHDQNKDFQEVFQKLENEKNQDEVYTYFR